MTSSSLTADLVIGEEAEPHASATATPTSLYVRLLIHPLPCPILLYFGSSFIPSKPDFLPYDARLLCFCIN